jgi:hypothetical protein
MWFDAENGVPVPRRAGRAPVHVPGHSGFPERGVRKIRSCRRPRRLRGAPWVVVEAPECLGRPGLRKLCPGQPQCAGFDETRLRDWPGPGNGVVAALRLPADQAAASHQLDNIFANVELLDGSRAQGADRPLGNSSEGACLQRLPAPRARRFAGLGDARKVPGLPSMLARASSSLPSLPTRALACKQVPALLRNLPTSLARAANAATPSTPGERRPRNGCGATLWRSGTSSVGA